MSPVERGCIDGGKGSGGEAFAAGFGLLCMRGKSEDKGIGGVRRVRLSLTKGWWDNVR